jgi:hypothetical protein
MKDNISDQLAQLEKEFAIKKANLFGKITMELKDALAGVLEVYEKFPIENRAGVFADEKFAETLKSLGLTTGKSGKRKGMSAEARKKISEGQKKRWAKEHAEKAK